MTGRYIGNIIWTADGRVVYIFTVTGGGAAVRYAWRHGCRLIAVSTADEHIAQDAYYRRYINNAIPSGHCPGTGFVFGDYIAGEQDTGCREGQSDCTRCHGGCASRLLILGLNIFGRKYPIGRIAEEVENGGNVVIDIYFVVGQSFDGLHHIGEG